MARNGHSLRLTPAELEARAKRLRVATNSRSGKPQGHKKPVPTETDEQQAVIRWWSLHCTKYGIPLNCLFSVPNGSHLAGDAKQRAIQMARLKREGLRAGCPDLMLAVPKWSGQYVLFHGLMVEMKRRIGGKPSPEQLDFADMLRKQGYNVVIAQGSDEAIRAITGYLEG